MFSGYGAIASAGGGFIQALAAGLAANAMRNATANQLDLQNRFRNEALIGTFQPRLQTSGVETAREQIATGKQNREQAYGRVQNTRLSTGPDRRTGRDAQAYKLSGSNRAGLGGYSDWQLEQMIANIRAQDELNRISNFAGGEARVFPQKLDAARHEFDSLAFIGQLVSSLGGAAGNYSQLFGAGAQPQPALFDAGSNFNTAQFGGYA